MPRRLTRQKDGSVLGGVASGFGAFFEVDPVLVRLAFILLALLEGIGIVFYVVCWVAMPQGSSSPGSESAGDAAGGASPVVDRAVSQARAAGERVAEEFRSAAARVSEAGSAALPAGGGTSGQLAGVASARAAAGVLLIVVGLAFLVDELGWFYWPRWARLDVLWPTLLIFLGAALVARSGWGRSL